MRTYKKRFLRRQFADMVSARTESRDAILWDVLPAQRCCRVKIQGSDTLIVANYPENWSQTPEWLKPGNAVRIIHRGGVRGYIEVAGHGVTLPTAVTGSVETPSVPAPPDAIMSGCAVQAFDPPQMGVIVRPGTIRIGGTPYILDDALMDGAAPWLMGVTNLVMGQVSALIRVPNPSYSGAYRLDIIAVGADLVIDYISGSPSGEPVQPVTPANHVLLDTVLVPPSVSSITQSYISSPFSPPVPSSLDVAIADNTLSWTELSTTITVTILNQYGRAVAAGSGYVTAEILQGNGTLSVGGASSTTIVGARVTESSVVFTYTRAQKTTDASPVFRFTLETQPLLTSSGYVTLLDLDGNTMW